MSPPIGVYSGPPPIDLRPQAKVVDFVFGLDLGKEMDYTALVVVERALVKDLARKNGRSFYVYTIRYIKRWQLNTLYTQIIPDVSELVERPPMAWPLLAVDYTGPGSSVVEFLRAAQPKARIHPVQITAGSAVTMQDGHWHVAKSVLVSTMQVLIQTERLKYADAGEGLGRLGDTLKKELHNFKRKVTPAGNESFEAWREKEHDDIVLATAIACWLGEQSGHDHFPKSQPQTTRPHTPMDIERARGANWRRRGVLGGSDSGDHFRSDRRRGGGR